MTANISPTSSSLLAIPKYKNYVVNFSLYQKYESYVVKMQK